jgi:hypothetical protein
MKYNCGLNLLLAVRFQALAARTAQRGVVLAALDADQLSDAVFACAYRPLRCIASCTLLGRSTRCNGAGTPRWRCRCGTRLPSWTR